VDLVDVAKGMSILLVAFQHSQIALICKDVSAAMGLFRMPLFFFLSGVFFSAVRSPKPFFFHKTDALLKPYFATLGILLLTTILLGRDGAVEEAVGIFYGTGLSVRWAPMWFLPHLWVLFMGSYFLVRLLYLDQWSAWFRFALVTGLIGLGVICLQLLHESSFTLFGEQAGFLGLPFSIDFIFISMAFFLSGHFLNRQVKVFTPRPTLLFLIVGIYFSIVIFSQAKLDLNARIYREPVLVTMAAVSGIYLVLSCAYYLSRYPRAKNFFKAFGTASLFILIFHYAIVHKVQWLLDQFFSPDWVVFTGAVAYAASVVLPLYIKVVISKNRLFRLFYFPLDIHSREKKQVDQPVPYNKIS
jgi:fucose 4-O-acetylase-like acetyltransferase